MTCTKSLSKSVTEPGLSLIQRHLLTTLLYYISYLPQASLQKSSAALKNIEQMEPSPPKCQSNFLRSKSFPIGIYCKTNQRFIFVVAFHLYYKFESTFSQLTFLSLSVCLSHTHTLGLFMFLFSLFYMCLSPQLKSPTSTTRVAHNLGDCI